MNYNIIFSGDFLLRFVKNIIFVFEYSFSLVCGRNVFLC